MPIGAALRWHAIVLCAVLFLINRLACAEQSDDSLGALIVQLGSEDSRQRNAAELELWRAGPAAERVLKDAAKSAVPEIALRARGLLDKLSLGAFADTSPAVVKLLSDYRTSDIPQKVQIVQQIQQTDPRASRTLALLWLREKVPETRDTIFHSYERGSMPEWTSELIALGNDAGATQIVRTFQFSGDERHARAAAAFYLLGKQLDSQIAELERKPLAQITRPEMTFLIYAHRANGDLNGAWRIARASGDVPATVGLAQERGDWAAAAAAMEKQPNVYTVPIPHAGRLLAYYRLAEDESQRKKMFKSLTRTPPTVEDCYKIYFLNDYVSEGMNVLLGGPLNEGDVHRGQSGTVALLCEQWRFAEAEQFVDRANRSVSTLLPLYSGLHGFGATQRANEILDELMLRARHDKDPGAYAQIAYSLKRLGLIEPLRRICIDGFSTLGESEQSKRLLTLCVTEANCYDPPYWLDQIRAANPTTAPGDLVDRLNTFLAGHLPLEEAKAILENNATRRAAESRMDEANLIDTIRLTAEYGIDDDHLERFAVFAAGDEPLIVLGDMLAGKKQWKRAIAMYESAWEKRSPRNFQGTPLPLVLKGHALEQMGQVEGGHEIIARAHRLFLAGDITRNAFVNGLEIHGLMDDRNLERKLAHLVGPFDDYENGQWFKDRGDELAATDPSTAASMWDRWLLTVMYGPGSSFIEPEAYMTVPMQIHQWRAQGYEKGGDKAAALREWRNCIAYRPADPDFVGRAVRILDSQGAKDEADKLYSDSHAKLLALCRAYPDSARAQNAVGWLGGRCRRDLDVALEHALAATRIEPDSPYHIDTLAEVYFARGDKAKAIELIMKAEKMAPNESQFEEHLKEIEKAP